MNVLMILNQSFPGDIRVEKECKALAANGHKILVTSTGAKDNEYEFAKIASISSKGTGLISKFLLRTLRRLPLLFARVTEAASDFYPDVIHVHDLQWASLGLKLSLKYGAKLVLDFHENFPAALEAGRISGGPLLRRVAYFLSSDPKRWRAFELKMVGRADKVIVVVPEALERFKNSGVNLSKFVVVSNTEDPSDWVPTDSNRTNDKFVISYIGGLGVHRGIDTIVNAMKYITSEEVVLRIVGFRDKTPYEKTIRSLVSKAGLQSRVILEQWVRKEEIAEVIRSSTLCTVPHNRSEHTETTIPHKLFQYMASSVPVLVSDVRPLRRVVENAKCGFVFEANNERSCADKINEALSCSVDKLREFGYNGRRAVEEDFNWKEDAARLVTLYDQLDK